MIQETYVTQETGMMIPEVISNYAYCKQIKELNYNDELGNIQRIEVKNTREFGMYFEVICQAPTHAVLAKWLRDVHKIQVYSSSSTKNMAGDYVDYTFTVNSRSSDHRDGYASCEEALEAGLQQALKLIPCKTN